MNHPYFLSSEQWVLLAQRVSRLQDLISVDIADQHQRAVLQREYGVLSQSLDLYKRLLDIEKEQATCKDYLISSENEMKHLLEEELVTLKEQHNELYLQLEGFVYPPSEESQRSVFCEIRAGTGGLEASLFAGQMARMYILYAQKKRWDAAIVSMAETDVGGCREIVLHVEGKGVYEELSHEAGVHRVQRVPETENSGRVHTSTITVAVLPEAEDVEVSINTADIRIDTYRASGAGGQHVNKTDSAVRITHMPSGIVVTCQDERSQHKNRNRAMKMLQAKLFALEKEKQKEQISQLRKEMSLSGERADKVRTYNFPQNRVTDHQVGLTINRLDYVMLGNLDEITEALVKQAQASRQVNNFFTQFFT